MDVVPHWRLSAIPPTTTPPPTRPPNDIDDPWTISECILYQHALFTQRYHSRLPWDRLLHRMDRKASFDESAPHTLVLPDWTALCALLDTDPTRPLAYLTLVLRGQLSDWTETRIGWFHQWAKWWGFSHVECRKMHDQSMFEPTRAVILRRTGGFALTDRPDDFRQWFERTMLVLGQRELQEWRSVLEKMSVPIECPGSSPIPESWDEEQ